MDPLPPSLPGTGLPQPAPAGMAGLAILLADISQALAKLPAGMQIPALVTQILPQPAAAPDQATAAATPAATAPAKPSIPTTLLQLSTPDGPAQVRIPAAVQIPVGAKLEITVAAAGPQPQWRVVTIDGKPAPPMPFTVAPPPPEKAAPSLPVSAPAPTLAPLGTAPRPTQAPGISATLVKSADPTLPSGTILLVRITNLAPPSQPQPATQPIRPQVEAEPLPAAQPEAPTPSPPSQSPPSPSSAPATAPRAQAPTPAANPSVTAAPVQTGAPTPVAANAPLPTLRLQPAPTAIAAATTPTPSAAPIPTAAAPLAAAVPVPTAAAPIPTAAVPMPAAAAPAPTAAAAPVPSAAQTPTEAPVPTPVPLSTAAPQPRAAAGPAAPSLATAPVPAPAPAPPAEIRGEVLPNNDAGKPLIKTPIGLLALSVAPQSAPPAGTHVTLAVVGKPIPSPASILPPQPDDPPDKALPRRLTQLVEQVQDGGNDKLAEAVRRAIPAPGPRLAAQLLSVIAAAEPSQGLPRWLGNGLVTALSHAAPEAMAQLSRQWESVAQPVQGPDEGDWRTLLLPLMMGGQMSLLRLTTRQPRRGATPADREKGTRFLLDLDLSRLGPMQFDGLVKRQHKSFDLIIRTKGPLPGEMRRDIDGLFLNGLVNFGLQGSVGFRSDESFVATLPLTAEANGIIFA